MGDPRESSLASLVVGHSLGIRPGEVCLIHAIDVPIEMVESLVQEVYAAGGIPLVELDSERLKRALTAGATPGSFHTMAQVDGYRMRQVDAYIGIRGPMNPLETSDLPDSNNLLYMSEYYRQVHTNIRIKDTRWVVMRYPTTSMALLAGMSTKGFTDYYYSVTVDVDYRRLSEAMVPAVSFLQKAKDVRIIGAGTDLTFSIAGMTAIPCAGHMNIPDGEIYTAPVRDSVNGVIRYNTPSTYQGFTFRDICLEFDRGRIVRASANDTVRLNNILDTDEGARYIGEFALGCNPAITSAMDNTLFDEKISGSFHFTPGHAYEDCDNGNRSAIHWDLVAIQTPEYGGGEMYIDGSLIRKDGRFCHSAFEGLNPDQLLR